MPIPGRPGIGAHFVNFNFLNTPICLEGQEFFLPIKRPLQ
jgi:hypothetical protein